MQFLPKDQEPKLPKAEVIVEKGKTIIRLVYPEPERGTREYLDPTEEYGDDSE